MHNGWNVDAWHTSQADVDRLLACYQALLAAGLGAPGASVIEQMLARNGVQVRNLLYDRDHRDDVITRADISEIAAAVTLMAQDRWPLGTLHMPNVPKGARNTSDRGIDVMAASLIPSRSLADDFDVRERVFFASVKHSVLEKTTDVRSKLLKSVGTEMTAAYAATQLRFYGGNLLKRGVPNPQRLLYALTGFPDPARVQVHAVAVIDTKRFADWTRRLQSLPATRAGVERIRVVLVDDLADLQDRCV